jgi:predicted phosphodiesterase
VACSKHVPVAAIYDVHGNLPALQAVLADVDRAGAEIVVVGGDVVSGPQPGETLDRLMALGTRARFVRGNGDREVVDAYDRGATRPADEQGRAAQADAFAASVITARQRDFLAGFEPTVTLEIDVLGPVLFCHGSPRSDTEIITTQTSDERLFAALSGVSERVIVGGHTHRQTDRMIGDRRYVNAGSVGAPYEGVAAGYWALLGPDVSLRKTDYDVDAAVRCFRRTGYPDVDEMLKDSLLDPADPNEIAAFFEGLASES